MSAQNRASYRFASALCPLSEFCGEPGVVGNGGSGSVSV
jgi:hypothetical protein